MNSMKVVHANMLELFGETIEKTGRWLDELMIEMGTSDPHHASSVLRAVLHVLRDRLTVAEAVSLGAQLPVLVRGLYYEGWRPAKRPDKYRHKAEFLQHVTEHYQGVTTIEQESVKAVFRVLSRHITGGEIRHARDQLPAEIRDLWDAHA